MTRLPSHPSDDAESERRRTSAERAGGQRGSSADRSDESDDDDRGAIARAMGLTSQVTAIAFEMAVPTLLGYWLDTMVGTGVLFLLVGVALGLTTSLWHLIQLAKQLSDGKASTRGTGEAGDRRLF